MDGADATFWPVRIERDGLRCFKNADVARLIANFQSQEDSLWHTTVESPSVGSRIFQAGGNRGIRPTGAVAKRKSDRPSGKHRIAGLVANDEFARMFASADIGIGDSSERLGQIDADP